MGLREGSPIMYRDALCVDRDTLNMVILATFSCKMNGDEVAVGCDSAT